MEGEEEVGGRKERGRKVEGGEREGGREGERKEGERRQGEKEKGRGMGREGGSKYAPSDPISPYNSPGAAEKVAAERGVWSHDRRQLHQPRPQL